MMTVMASFVNDECVNFTAESAESAELFCKNIPSATSAISAVKNNCK